MDRKINLARHFFNSFFKNENKFLTVFVVSCTLLYLLVLLYGIRFESSGSYNFRTIFSSRYSFPVTAGDPEQYIQLGKNLFSHHVLSDHFNEPYTPSTFRTPGYPVFVSLIKAVFGSYVAVSLIQIIMVIAVAVIIIKIGQKIHSDTLGFIAASLFVLDPVIISYAIVVSTDILFIFLLALVFYFIFFRSYNSVKNFFIYGLLLGAAILVRPIGIYLPLIFIPGIYFISRDSSVEKTKKSVLFLLALFIVVFPWMLRNKIIANSLSISSVSAFDLATYFTQNFASSKQNGDGDMIYNQVIAVEQKYLDTYRPDPADQWYSPVLTDLRHSGELNAISWNYLKPHIFGYTLFHLKNSLIYFFMKSSIAHALDYAPHLKQTLIAHYLIPAPNRYTDLLKIYNEKSISDFIKAAKSNGILLFEKLSRFLLLILAIIPLFFYRKDKRRYVLIFWSMTLYFALLSGSLSNARYRIPAEPFMMILVALGLMLLINKFKARRSHT